MSKNTLFQYWPVVIGEFYNNEHNNLKKDLINFFNDYEKKNPKGNKQLHDKNYTCNHNLYQSSYNLHQEKNDALVKARSSRPGDTAMYGKPGQDLNSKIQSGEIKIV